MKRILFLLLLACPVPLLATDFYIDPNWGGTQTGAAATPWTSLNSHWGAIDGELANGNVTIYFSAREASSDTDETTTTQMLLNRGDTSTNRLTINCNGKYNTTDYPAAPSWSDYSGNSKFFVHSTPFAGFDTNNNGSPYTSRNYWTVHGCKFQSTNQPVVIGPASHVSFEYNDMSSETGANTGPTLIVQHYPKGDTTSANYSTDIAVTHNNFHDGLSESIYIGGSSDDPGSNNVQTQTDVTISYNTITNPGRYGPGQGDGIDVKDGNVNVQIIGNVIDQTDTQATDARCITFESAALVEGNFLKNCVSAAMAATQAWSNTHGRDGTIIRNNIAIAGTSYALWLDTSSAASIDLTNFVVVNNTFLKPAGTGNTATVVNLIGTVSALTGLTFKNNIVIGRDSSAALNCSGTVTFTAHDHNSYWKDGGASSWVTCGSTYSQSQVLSSWEATAQNTEPLLVSESTPYLDTNFKLQATSPAKDAGTTISGFSTDYAGTSRPQGAAWDIGAYEYPVVSIRVGLSCGMFLTTFLMTIAIFGCLKSRAGLTPIFSTVGRARSTIRVRPR